ncbi:MAG: AMP-binding protein, partial [Myxococcales bacterium]|nr:AMP-binding protein [Myxococcales bacterium]
VGVLEFYASTEGNAVLANASGEKVGALGQPLPGATDMSIVAWDFRNDDFVRDEQGFLQRCGVDREGMLIARVDRGHPMAGFDGYVGGSDRERIAEGVFEAGDRWFVSGDLLRQDADGDFWFVDRLSDVVRTEAGPVFTREVEDLIYRRPDVKMVAVHAWAEGRPAEVAATIVTRGEGLDVARLGALLHEKLEARARPRYLRVVETIPLTDGYRPLKRPLEGAREAGTLEVWERVDGAYRRIGAAPSPEEARAQ